MKGILKIYQGDQLLAHQRNQIHPDLEEYLIQRFNSDVDRSLTSLFTEFDLLSEHLGQDGIIFFDSFLNTWYTIPTSIAASGQIGRVRFQGIVVPDDSFVAQSFQLGHDGLGAGAERFSTMYATASLPEETTYFANVPVIIIWDITVGKDE
jgi:hypothetical protein